MKLLCSSSVEKIRKLLRFMCMIRVTLGQPFLAETAVKTQGELDSFILSLVTYLF